MTYDLAKKLKNAGFRQDGDNRERDPWGEGTVPVMITETTGITDEKVLDSMRQQGPTYMVNPDGSHTKISDKGIIPVHEVYVPLLHELIEACGDRFIGVRKVKEGSKWGAEAEGLASPTQKFLYKLDGIVFGDTPEEAVANLWLALNASHESCMTNENPELFSTSH